MKTYCSWLRPNNANGNNILQNLVSKLLFGKKLAAYIDIRVPPLWETRENVCLFLTDFWFIYLISIFNPLLWFRLPSDTTVLCSVYTINFTYSVFPRGVFFLYFHVVKCADTLIKTQLMRRLSFDLDRKSTYGQLALVGQGQWIRMTTSKYHLCLLYTSPSPRD